MVKLRIAMVKRNLNIIKGKYMKNWNIVFIIVLLFHIDLVAQNSEIKLLEELKHELFSSNKDSIKLSEYLNTCKSHQVDSNIFIRLQQPSKTQIFSILEKILHRKDTLMSIELAEIYNIHLDFFEKEWKKVNRENFYSCELIRNQVKILQGFEEVFKGISISNLSDSLKFEFYYSEQLLNIELIMNPNGKNNIINKYFVTSKRYKEILSDAWLQEGPSFMFLDPYLNGIQRYLIGRILEAHDISFKYDERLLVLNNMKNLIAKFDNDEMKIALRQVVENVISHDMDNFIIFYLSKNYDPDLLRIVTKNKFDKAKSFANKLDKLIYIDLNINLILQNGKNLNVILDEMAKLNRSPDNELIIFEALRYLNQPRFKNDYDKWIIENKNDFNYFNSIISNFNQK